MESTWGLMDFAEAFDIARYKLMLRFDRVVGGKRMTVQSQAALLCSGPATRTFRVVSADRAEFAFSRVSDESDH